MALIDVWKADKAQLAEKHIKQVIGFAGDGKLSDNSDSATELRDYFRNIPSDLIKKYADECIGTAFDNNGFALQDLVNEIGQRLGFDVTPGRYRGVRNEIGFDGIWSKEGGHSIVVEVKTETKNFSINLDTISDYRRALAKDGMFDLEKSSMLIVSGRGDSGGLEAQIRGSQHAWEMRIISVEALFRMLKLKEEIDDPTIVQRIHEILIPREFTRLDPIVDIAFSTAEEIKNEEKVKEELETSDPDDAEPSKEKKFTPVAFHSECVSRIEKHLSSTLLRQSRSSFASADHDLRLVSIVSRQYNNLKKYSGYWFAFKPQQDEFLSGTDNSFVAFGCGDPENLFLIPYSEFKPMLEHFNKTETENRSWWHIRIRNTEGEFIIRGRKNAEDFQINKYKIQPVL